MKIFFCLIFIFSFFSFSCPAQIKSPYPILELNDKYNQIQQANAHVSPQNYTLNSLKGFILDCSSYDFSLIKKMNDNKPPDFVHLISKSGRFTIKLNSTGQTVINSSTMLPPEGDNKKFSGFVKGEKAMLAIGTIKKNEMVTYWLGMVEIK